MQAHRIETDTHRMLKKMALGIFVLLLAGAGYIAIKLLIPLQASADRNGPDTAPRDYAMQDDSKVNQT